MSGPEVLAALARFAQNSQLFALLDAAGVERLSTMGEIESFATGDTVVRQGDEGDCFYLIAAGEVRVLVEEAGDKEVARLGAGSFFGEIGVVTQQPRSATVEATESSQLIRFARDPVLTLLRDYPMVREVIGGVGLMRSESNLEQVLASDEQIGLAEALEAEEGEGQSAAPESTPQVAGASLDEEDLFADLGLGSDE